MWLRICRVIAAIICQLIFNHRVASSRDFLFNSWTAMLCNQAIQCISIICSSVPQFKTLMESLRSSGMGIHGMTMGSARGKGNLLGGSRTNASTSRVIESGSAGAAKDEIPLGRIRVRRSIEMSQSHAADWDSGSETSRSKIVKGVKA